MRNIFRCLIFLFLMITMPSLIFADTVYYVDATNGDDSNDGLSTTNAWKTISKVNKTSFFPGDIIKLKKGEVWREKLIIPSSGSPGNPITFTNYGSGNNPLLLGSLNYDTTGQWSDIGSSEWATANSSFTTNPECLWYDTDSTPVLADKVTTPDSNWEWRYDSGNDRVVVYHTVGNPASQTAGLEIADTGIANIIQNTSKNYITIDGIDCRFNENTGIYIPLPCSGIIIQNLTASYTKTTCVDVYNPIGTFTIDNVTVTYSHARNGIRVMGATAGTISKCTVTYVDKMGIDINTCDSVTVEDCVVTPYTNVAGGRGSCIGGDDFNNCIIQNNDLSKSKLAGVDLQGNFAHNDSNIVRYNLIHDTGRSGVAMSGFDDRGAGVTSDNNEVYYNVIYNTAARAISFLQAADSNEVYNNVIYGGNLSAAAIWFSIIPERGNTNPQNNIVKNNVIYSTDKILVKVNGFTSTNNTLDYNCYYNDHAGCFVWNGTNYNTFTAYQSASGQDTNSLGNTDPQWVDAGSNNFHVQLFSACREAGTDVGLTADYDGNPVPYGWGVEIGAYEYVGDVGAIPLNAEINASPTSGYMPLAVDFTGTVTGGTEPYSFSWDFGDGESSSEQNPSHAYSQAGTYSVTLTVTDSNSNQASDFLTITVSSPPLSASASASPTSGYVPLTVNFTASTSGGTSPFSYSWNFGDGATSSDQNSSHTYSQAGTYSVTLTVTDSNSNQASDSLTITASSNPTFNLTISSATGSPAPGEGGTTNPSPGDHSYPSESSVQVKATPKTNYRFSKWTGDVSNSERYNEEITITMDKDRSISAHFYTKCGDVNGDLSITPADAQAAFNIFLGRISNPTDSEKENADVNSDGTKTAPNITPADAQAIFNRFLGRSELPSDCSGNSRTGSVLTQRMHAQIINLLINYIQGNLGEEIFVHIIVDNPSNIKAFGFDLLFLSEALEFVGMERTELLKDFYQADANKIAEGVLRVGGYRSTSIMDSNPQILITLIFKVIGEAKKPTSFVIINTVDDIENASAKK